MVYIGPVMSPGPQKQFDRAEVLEKAMRLFWTQGYEATGMSKLLEHVSLSGCGWSGRLARAPRP